MNAKKLISACVVGLMLVTGCSTPPRRVSCEEHLQPINPVVPKAAAAHDGIPSQPGSVKGQVTP